MQILSDKFKNMENQNTSQPKVSEQKSEKTNSMVMGILAYLGILIVIPLIVSRNKPFVKFHIKQGLILLAIDIILWFIKSWFWVLIPLINLFEVAVFVLVIIGIINVAHKKEKALPIVGSLSKYFTF